MSGGKTCDFPGCMEIGWAVPRPPDLRAVPASSTHVPAGPSVVVACETHRTLVIGPFEARKREAPLRSWRDEAKAGLDVVLTPDESELGAFLLGETTGEPGA